MSDTTMSTELTQDDGYQRLVTRISEVYTTGRVRAEQAVNDHMTETYWEIGHDIVEFEQGGKVRAEYGKALLANLSQDLTLRQGRGFSRSNLSRFRQFFLAYPICATVSHKLGWSVLIELLKFDDPLERSFYKQQTIREKRTVRELQRHKDELLVEYATYGMNSQLFVQKYQLYLPDRDELRREIERTLRMLEAEAANEGACEPPGASRGSASSDVPSAPAASAVPLREARP